jgi:uncharacterized membrane protein
VRASSRFRYQPFSAPPELWIDLGLDHDDRQSQSPRVSTRRLEAFSDGVFAIAITLLALELRVPELPTITPQALAAALAAQWPTYLSFLLSFVTLLIAWIYHHRYVIAAGLAFWRPAVTLIICGALWVVWTVKAPMRTPDA